MSVFGFDSLNPIDDAGDCLLFLAGSNEGSSYVLHASGELDLSTRHLVEPACPTSDSTNVIVDLAELTFMDCSGYSGLEVARQRLHTIGGTLTLRSAHGPVLRLLNLIELFDSYPPDEPGRIASGKTSVSR